VRLKHVPDYHGKDRSETRELPARTNNSKSFLRKLFLPRISSSYDPAPTTTLCLSSIAYICHILVQTLPRRTLLNRRVHPGPLAILPFRTAHIATKTSSMGESMPPKKMA